MQRQVSALAVYKCDVREHDDVGQSVKTFLYKDMLELALQYLNANGMRPWVSLHGVAFSELRDRLQDGLPCMDVPLGLIRMQQYGIRQAIIEVDFADPFTDWSRLSDASLLALIVQRCAWVQQHLSLPGQPAAAYINMRDLPAAMRVRACIRTSLRVEELELKVAP